VTNKNDSMVGGAKLGVSSTTISSCFSGLVAVPYTTDTVPFPCSVVWYESNNNVGLYSKTTVSGSSQHDLAYCIDSMIIYDTACKPFECGPQHFERRQLEA